MDKNLKQLKNQMVILDILPFGYNFFALVIFIIFLFEDIIFLNALFGFSTLTCIDLLFRSLHNNYCAWHRVPIFNMFMMNIYSMIYIIFPETLCNIHYPVLFILFWIWVLTFLISGIVFLKKRLKKTVKRCCQ